MHPRKETNDGNIHGKAWNGNLSLINFTTFSFRFSASLSFQSNEKYFLTMKLQEHMNGKRMQIKYVHRHKYKQKGNKLFEISYETMHKMHISFSTWITYLTVRNQSIFQYFVRNHFRYNIHEKNEKNVQ